jgi:hypothetical protein
MIFYLIFDINGKYKGYTKDKKILKLLLKQRKKDKYTFKRIKIDKKDIEEFESVANNKHELSYELTTYDTEKGKLILFGFEDAIVTTKILEMLSGFDECINDLYKAIKYVKFSKEEKTTIEHAISILSQMSYDLMTNEGLLDDLDCYINLQKAIKKLIL